MSQLTLPEVMRTQNGYWGYNHSRYQNSAQVSGSQTLPHVRIIWRIFKNVDAQTIPQASENQNCGWLTQVSVLLKSFLQIMFLRLGDNRETSFPGERKEVSGKLAQTTGFWRPQLSYLVCRCSSSVIPRAQPAWT